MPKRIKHRRVHRGKIKGYATRGNRVTFGDFGLQALDAGWITGRQLEASRVAANRATRGAAKIWIRVFPDKPISSKPAETRMGKGKGDIDFWAAEVKPGTILFELGNVTEDKAKLAFKRIAHKMPIKVRMVKRRADDLIARCDEDRRSPRKTDAELEFDLNGLKKELFDADASSPAPGPTQHLAYPRDEAKHRPDQRHPPRARAIARVPDREASQTSASQETSVLWPGAASDDRDRQQQPPPTRATAGVVVSDSSAGMDKTITVRVERIFKHPKYKKYIRRHSKVHAHDETKNAMVGDVVTPSS